MLDMFSLNSNYPYCVCHSLLQSRIHFCGSIYHGVAKKHLSRLQRVMNAMKRITRSADVQNVSIENFVAAKVAVLCYKAITNCSPSYISDLIHYKSHSRALRSNDQYLLNIPHTQSASGSRTFSVAAPRIWNVIPLQIRQTESLQRFTQLINNHFAI